MTLSPIYIRELLEDYEENLAESGLCAESSEIIEEILEALPELLDDHEELGRQMAILKERFDRSEDSPEGCDDLNLARRVAELESEASEREDMYMNLLRHRNALTYEAESKVAELQEALIEWHDSVERAMRGECGHSDEVHCSCYPVLKKAIESLNAEIDRLRKGWIARDFLLTRLDEAMASPERITEDTAIVGGFVSGLDLTETDEQIIGRAIKLLGERAEVEAEVERCEETITAITEGQHLLLDRARKAESALSIEQEVSAAMGKQSNAHEVRVVELAAERDKMAAELAKTWNAVGMLGSRDWTAKKVIRGIRKGE